MSDSQPAEPGLSDSQPAEPGLSDRQPAVENQEQEADEEMQAQEGSKLAKVDVLFAPERKLYSVNNTMFFVILLWVPRTDVNPVRSFYEWRPQQPLIYVDIIIYV